MPNSALQLTLSEEATGLTQALIVPGPLPANAVVDAVHIAIAAVNACIEDLEERIATLQRSMCNDVRGGARNVTPLMPPRYTRTQGRYLAFIHYYTKLHGIPPAEADIQRYFKVSPPAVHQMILTLVRLSQNSRSAIIAFEWRIALPYECSFRASLLNIEFTEDMHIKRLSTSQ